MVDEISIEPREALRGQMLGMVVFFAPGCKDCVISEPFEEALSSSFPDVKVLRFDAIASDAIADSYGIERYPTYIFFLKGRPLGHPLIEPISEGEARNWLEDKLAYAERLGQKRRR